MMLKAFFSIFAPLTIMALLSACGGGDGGDTEYGPVGEWEVQEIWFDHLGNVYAQFEPYQVTIIQDDKHIQIDEAPWLYLSGPLEKGIWRATGYAIFSEGQCDYEVVLIVEDNNHISGDGTYSFAGSSGSVEFTMTRITDGVDGGDPGPDPGDGDPSPEPGDDDPAPEPGDDDQDPEPGDDDQDPEPGDDDQDPEPGDDDKDKDNRGRGRPRT